MPAIPPISRAADLAPLLDHTILKPEATPEQVRRYCREARQHGFRSVCVNPVYVSLVNRELAGAPVGTCSVVAFPFGATTTAAKVRETELAVADGAAEIDMVMALGALKAGEHGAVQADIAAVKRACGRALLKVIIETCLLTDPEKELACRLAQAAGADFVKTSTGYAGSGATVEDVRLMRRVIGPEMGLKASGGVRSFAQALAMIAAGATRIGTSSGVALISVQSLVQPGAQ